MKVAIVGGAPGWDKAPFGLDWEIWVLGNQMDRYGFHDVTRIFEVHENLEEHDPQYPQWLVDQEIPLVVSDKFPIDCGHAIEFDYERASMIIGENFSSSIAVMMAQAIMDGATEIGIWGVKMALDEHEYFMQRPSMEQWIGYAKGIGIRVYIQEDSPLGYTTYREGRDWPNKAFEGYDENAYTDMAHKHKNMLDEIEVEIAQLADAEKRLESLRASYQAHDGAKQVYERLAKLQRARSSGLDVNLEDTHG